MDRETTDRLVKIGTVLGVVLVVYVGVLALNAIKENKYIGGGVPGTNVITVSGVGEVFAAPDIAEITFEVVEERATAAEAQEASATKMNAILAFLRDSDIDEKDIKTTYYTSNPRYEWRDGGVVPMGVPIMESSGGGTSAGSAGVSADMAIAYPYPGPDNDTRVLVGYEVRQSVSVKVRDTEDAGVILAGLIEQGATNTYGPNFTIDDEDELMRQARRDAIKDARDKARELADDLDVRLVRVVSFSESGGGYYPYRGGMEMAAYDSAAVKVTPELPPGENQINAYVTITYEIR